MRSTSMTRSAGTRGHWLTADRVTPRASAKRVAPPMASKALLFARNAAVSMVSDTNQDWQHVKRH